MLYAPQRAFWGWKGSKDYEAETVYDSLALGVVFTSCTVALAGSHADLGNPVTDANLKGNPVTDADLRGKKICWSNGTTSTYNNDGSYERNGNKRGSWHLDGGQIELSAYKDLGSGMVTREGDTFHTVHRQMIKKNASAAVEGWGKYCN
jgi:hypothetical protein